jgi:hypothetical protein
MKIRSRGFVLSVLGVVATICVVAAVAVLVGDDGKTNTGDDCAIVAELVDRWRDETGAALEKLANSNDGRGDTLALANKESELAERIRATSDEVTSTDIARELDRWATGADQLAQVHRDQIYRPNPDITAPPPPSFIQGSVAVNEATNNLVLACPSAGPQDADA